MEARGDRAADPTGLAGLPGPDGANPRRRRRYQVEEAINGLEGLEKVLLAPFDLCVVDVNMPMMDGYAFLNALRAEPATRAIPALMTSTEAEAEDRLSAFKAGANFYMVKPVPRDQLALYVAALIGGSAA